MLGSVSVSVVCSPSGTPHNSHEISGVTKTSTKIKSVKKKRRNSPPQEVASDVEELDACLVLVCGA